MLLARLLNRLVQTGSLAVIDHRGRERRFGEAGGAPQVTVRLNRPGVARQLALRPELGFGEAYMRGDLTVEVGDIYDLLELLCRNIGVVDRLPLARLRALLRPVMRRLSQDNPLHRAQRHVRHHYDLSGALYDLFLDADRQYSCAYFPHPEASLEEAQLAKKRHIAAKLLLKPGQHVLDIGSGWGGLALHLARTAGVQVTGITLSREQHALSEARALEAGLSDRVRFLLTDYREVQGRFDRIVSVGMFEHVGVPHYGEFFGKVTDLLTEDGVALLHSIGRMDGPGVTNVWLRRYIFPGGYSPALSEVMPMVERHRLWITDIEILRLHYAETLRHWRQRFLARRDRARALYDETFCRMWEFYLAGCECVFRYSGQMVFQMQMARRVDAVPLTRDYIAACEHSDHGRAVAAA